MKRLGSCLLAQKQPKKQTVSSLKNAKSAVNNLEELAAQLIVSRKILNELVFKSGLKNRAILFSQNVSFLESLDINN